MAPAYNYGENELTQEPKQDVSTSQATHYAHSLPDRPIDEWESMQQHENAVANRCQMFAEQIGPGLGSWGEILGKWHDLGKYSEAFQKYIRSANKNESSDVHQTEIRGRVDHSTAAAQYAVEKFGLRGKLLAYCFAGHHAGLPDWDDGISQAGLRHRLSKTVEAWKTNVPDSVLDLSFPEMPDLAKPEADQHEIAAFRVAFWVRIMFSALVDADFLATEEFMSPNRHLSRANRKFPMIVLQDVLEHHILTIESNTPRSNVNALRKKVSQLCFKAASFKPGFFSLNVPTGGGKTLASLRFAIAHARAHNLSRIIVGIPFTSIIEQNADVYRNIFASLGEEVVIEHHSNLDPTNETTLNRLQSENWDAPIVVTTNVQLFESLFACRTSKCRRLHNLANCVIILDEAQTLPVELLKPTLLALQELVLTFGCTVVLCTATQPALDYRLDFPIGIKNIRPIIVASDGLYQSLKRVQLKPLGKLNTIELTQRLDSHNQVLCIVNTRPFAAEVFSDLQEKRGRFHLSTRMCAAHRLSTLKKIRRQLTEKQTCRVVSTQLIEAGVDVDFPVVYRADCGLDSLAQAAGRCNREGLSEVGQVYYFETEKRPPPGFLRQTADCAKELHEKFDDLLSPDAVEEYFRLFYWKKNLSWDKFEVLAAIGNQPNKIQFNFRQIASRYRFIRDESDTILVPWKKRGQQLIRRLIKTKSFLDQDLRRHLQPYCVQVRSHELMRLVGIGAVEQIQERWVLAHAHIYDRELGLMLENTSEVLPIEDTII